MAGSSERRCPTRSIHGLSGSATLCIVSENMEPEPLTSHATAFVTVTKALPPMARMIALLELESAIPGGTIGQLSGACYAPRD